MHSFCKILIRLDQHTFHLLCGVKGDINHTNCECLFNVLTLENAAEMVATNIQLSQAPLSSRSSTGVQNIRGQMASVQGFPRMAQGLMDLPHHSIVPSDMSPSDSLLNYLPKIGASCVCLCQKGETNKFVVKMTRLHKPKAILLITVFSKPAFPWSLQSEVPLPMYWYLMR
jgi:hypothetical protein